MIFDTPDHEDNAGKDSKCKGVREMLKTKYFKNGSFINIHELVYIQS